MLRLVAWPQGRGSRHWRPASKSHVVSPLLWSELRSHWTQQWSMMYGSSPAIIRTLRTCRYDLLRALCVSPARQADTIPWRSSIQGAPSRLRAETTACAPCAADLVEVEACTATSAAVCIPRRHHSCAAGWHSGGGSMCFRAGLVQGPAATAAQGCASTGGLLAIVDGASDEAAVRRACVSGLATAGLPADVGCWVGLWQYPGRTQPTRLWLRAVSRGDSATWVPRVPAGDITVAGDDDATPLCGHVVPQGSAALNWTVGDCERSRIAVCAAIGATGVRTTFAMLSCSSPGCTASAMVDNVVPDGVTSVRAATLSMLVQQLDLSAPTQRIESVAWDGVHVSTCLLGGGGQACNVDDWRLCGTTPSAIDVSPVPRAYTVAVSAPVAVSTPCEDGAAIVRAEATVAVSVVVPPTPVLPRLARTTGDSATVAWTWPSSHGGSPVDSFTVHLGDKSTHIPVDTHAFAVTRLLQGMQTVAVHGTDHGEQLEARCPLSTVVAWGFALHLSVDSAADISDCMAANTRACEPGHASCGQTACDGDVGAAYRVVLIACQVPEGVPTWAAAHQHMALRALGPLDDAVQCEDEYSVLFGFSLARAPTLGSSGAFSPEEAQAASCAQANTFACQVGVSECRQTGCGPAEPDPRPPAVLYTMCAPHAAVEAAGVSVEHELVHAHGGVVSCPASSTVAWGLGVYAGNYGVNDVSAAMTAAATTFSCESGAKACAMPPLAVGAALLASVCVPDTVARPEFTHVFYGTASELSVVGALTARVAVANKAGATATYDATNLVVASRYSSGGATIPSAPAEASLATDGATGGQLHVMWPVPSDNGGSSGGITGYEVAAAEGTCVAGAVVPTSGAATTPLPAPVLSLRGWDAASTGPFSVYWPAWVNSMGGVAQVQGAHGYWMAIGGMELNSRPGMLQFSTLAMVPAVERVAVLRITMPNACAGTPPAITEIEVAAAAGGTNIARGAAATTNTAASPTTLAAVLTDGACDGGCGYNATDAWVPSCGPGDSPWVAIHLGGASVGEVIIRWALGSSPAADVRVEVVSPVSPSLLFSPDGGGSLTLVTPGLFDYDLSSSCPPPFHVSVELMLASNAAVAAAQAAVEPPRTEWAVEAWVRVVRMGSAAVTVISHGLAGLGVAVGPSRDLYAVDFSLGQRVFAPSVAPSGCVRVARVVLPDPSHGTGDVAEFSWMHVLVSLLETGSGGLTVDGGPTAPWSACTVRGVALPGVVQTPAFGENHTQSFATTGAWTSASPGVVSLDTAVVTGSSAEHRGTMHVADRFVAGGMTAVGGSPSLLLGDAYIAGLGTRMGVGSTWRDLDLSVDLSLDSTGNEQAIRTIAYRYMSQSDYHAVSIGTECSCWQGWVVKAGSRRDLVSRPLAASVTAPGSTVRVRVVAVGAVTTLFLNGDQVSGMRVTDAVLETAPAAVVIGYADATGTVNNTLLVSLDPAVRMGIPHFLAASTWGGVPSDAARTWRAAMIRVHRVAVFDEVPDPDAAMSLMRQSVPSSSFTHPTRAACSRGYTPFLSSTMDRFDLDAADPASGWFSESNVGVGECEVALDDEVMKAGTYSSGHALGGGGKGWHSAGGSMGSGTSVRRVVSSNGRAHTHALVSLSMGFLGQWQQGDSVSVFVSDTLEWVGTHVSPRECEAGWTLSGSFCYQFIDDMMAWDVAQATCSSMDASILSVGDRDEIDAVAALAVKDAWTGLNDIAVEGRHEWVDGSGYAYRRWAAASGTAAADATDCTVLQSDGFMQPVPCDEKHAALCKKPVLGTQCGPTLRSTVADIVVPHTADSVSIHIAVSARSQHANVVLFVSRVKWRLLSSPDPLSFPTPPVNFTIPPSGELVMQGLKPNQAYCLAAAAVNIKGRGPFSPAVTVSTVDVTPPAVPNAFAVNATTGGSIAVQWSPPSDVGGAAVSHYLVRLRPSAPPTGPAQAFALPQTMFLRPRCDSIATGASLIPADSTCAVVGNLVAGTLYDLEVVAVNVAGEGTAAQLVGVATKDVHASEPPRNVRLAAATGGMLTVAWDSPFDNGGTHILRHIVTYEVASVVTEVHVDSHSGSSDDDGTFVLRGLDAETEVSFTVAAHNLPSCLPPSTFSPPLLATTTVPSPPSPPTDPAIAGSPGVTGGAASLSWAAPDDLGGVALSGFSVYKVFSNGSVIDEVWVDFDAWHASSWSEAETVYGSTTVGGLEHTTAYEWVVTATNAAGESSRSSSITATTDRVTRPSPPRDVTGVPVAGDVVSVQWQVPLDTGGVPTLTYHVMRRIDGDAVVKACATTTSSLTPSCSITGLSAETEYIFYVTATNEAGAGEVSGDTRVSTTAATPPTQVPPPQLAASASPCDGYSPLLSSCNPGGGSVQVVLGGDFLTGGTAASLYAVELLVEGVWEQVYSGVAPAAVVSGLAAHTTYQLRQVVFNSAGSGISARALSVTTSSVTKPGQPSVPVETSVNGSSVCFHWSKPVDDGGGTILSYAIYVSSTTTTPLQCLTHSSQACVEATPQHVDVTESGGAACVGELEANTPYHWRVSASNAAAQGPLSTASIVSTSDPTPATVVPSVSFGDVQADRARVSWTLPVDTGGGPLVAFNVSIVPAPGTELQSDVPGTVAGINVVALSPATTYSVAVRAVTLGSAGLLFGAWSTASTFTTALPGAAGYASFATSELHLLEADAGQVFTLTLNRQGGTNGILSDDVGMVAASYIAANGTTLPLPAGSVTMVDDVGVPGSAVGDTVGVAFSQGVTTARVNVTFINDEVYQQEKVVELCLAHTAGAPTGPATTCTRVFIADDGDAGVIGLRSVLDAVSESATAAELEVYRLPGYVP